MKNNKALELAGLILNAGYLALMLVWFSRNPQNPTNPGAYTLMLPPFLSLWCIYRRPIRIGSLVAGLIANILNLVFLFVAFVGMGFSGKRIGEFGLMALFVIGNFLLMLYSWIRATALAAEEKAQRRQAEIQNT